jgi:hypothetical protein
MLFLAKEIVRSAPISEEDSLILVQLLYQVSDFRENQVMSQRKTLLCRFGPRRSRALNFQQVTPSILDWSPRHVCESRTE